jgi:hypothetical protein
MASLISDNAYEIFNSCRQKDIKEFESVPGGVLHGAEFI